AKNESFQKLVQELGQFLLTNKPESLESALELKMDNGQTVNEYINAAIATIGEKLTLRRFEVMTKTDNGVFGEYLHMGGRIAALSVIEGTTDANVAKDVSMH